MDEAFGVASAGASRALLQLCGEVLLTAPPTRQPSIVRRGAAVGLELLDLLLNPDHVVRATEHLTLRNTVTLGRRVELDISLDRLSRSNEERAMQLSALISGRVSSDDGRPNADGHLWLPLGVVPRPLSVPVLVSDGNGNQLTRPPQRKVRMALEAALYHILRESLRGHPDFDGGQGAVNTIMRDDERARWLLQAALVAVCEVGPDTPRSSERRQAVVARMPSLTADTLTPAQVTDALEQLALQELADDGTDRHRTLALQVLCDALADDVPFLRLVDLVHGHDIVAASLDRTLRDQSVQYDLPDAEARPESVIEKRYGRSRRMFDPREHNYTVHMWVPLPENLPQYNLCVRAPAGSGPHSDSEVSLIAAVHYDDHPARTAIDAVTACADELVRTFGSYDWSRRDLPADAVPDPDPDVRKVRFIASRALAALDRIEAIVDLQVLAAEELEVRWARASRWTVRQSVSQLNEVAAAARSLIDEARTELAVAEPAKVHGQALRAARALRTVAEAVEHRLLALQLVSSEVPGQEIARLRINQAKLASRAVPHPRSVEVWATVSDEAQPYAYAAVVQPLAFAWLTYIVGCLLFDTTWWPWPGEPLNNPVLAGGPDAIVAVLLLIPAFALTQTGLPERRSVAGVLRRPARLFVFGSVVTLCLTAITVATQVATAAGGDQDRRDDALHPHLMLWTFRGTLVFFLAWTVWATVAWGLRRWFVWRPKGLRALFGAEPSEVSGASGATGASGPTGASGVPGPSEASTVSGWTAAFRRLGRPWPKLGYANKAPDAEFDLSLPSQSFPSRRKES
ncbi:MAG TPA: hypothetical protein VGO78_22930 [Acidimicrobiales bacterium]|nr:hypothetical protein [Acidimicrobiales bacterium]